jgi:hypothetical protein
MVSLLEDSCNICGFKFVDWAGFLAVRDLQVRSHIVGAISKVDLEVLVTKNLLFLAKNRVGVSRIKGRNMLETRVRGRYKADVNHLVGVRQPLEKRSVLKGNASCDKDQTYIARRLSFFLSLLKEFIVVTTNIK